ncbi:MAG: ankyrin repeat domain-containing protein, partial [Firmicutes bacterium]|nr:ankyrin repeat domain-containing protein [Bacillota bacterium]
QPHQQLLQQWIALCGDEGDLTWAALEMYRMPRANLQTMLKELGKGRRLVMDADSLSAYGREAKWELMDILTHVELRHNTGLEGVSSLAANLLKNSDLRYLRKAAKLGAFAGENPKALLEHLERINKSNLRALMLAYGGQGEDPSVPRWKQECRRRQWIRVWDIDRKSYEEWLAKLIHEELPEDECLRRLQVMHYAAPMDTFWRLDCSISVKLPETSRRREIQVSAPEAAVLCGQQTKPLELMLRYMPETLEKRFRVEFCDRTLLDLEGSPLTIAAATGCVEQVKFLLNAGLEPDETGRGLMSSLRWFGNGELPVTPVMAAIYYGEEETAKLLLEAGAVCDFSKPLFRKLLERGDEQTLELAQKLQNVNFESISQDWLENLKEKTCF